MEQPLNQSKSLFSDKARIEAYSFFKLATPMFLTQLALQLIQVNSVIQSGNYSTDVQAGIMLAGNLWIPIMVGIGGVLFFVTPMVAQLFGAKKIDEISHLEVIKQGLQPMDSTAITLCMDNHLPIVMFDLMSSGNVRSILAGETVGTLVS